MKNVSRRSGIWLAIRGCGPSGQKERIFGSWLFPAPTGKLCLPQLNSAPLPGQRSEAFLKVKWAGEIFLGRVTPSSASFLLFWAFKEKEPFLFLISLKCFFSSPARLTLSHYNFTYFYKRNLTATEHVRRKWQEGGVRGSEAGREAERELPTARGPPRTPLGDTFRKACLSTIWQHGPMASSSETP